MKRRLLFWLSVTFVVLFLMACLGIIPPPVLFVAYLLVGWTVYIGRVMPEIRLDLSGLLMATIALAGVLVLGHFLARWLWRETAIAGLTRRPWQKRWTASAATVILLMFVAGIAATGITHQSVWLAKSDKPMFTWQFRTRAARDRSICLSNVRQVGQAILLYAQEHQGRFPDTLEQVILTQDITAECFICPGSDIDKAEGKTPEGQARHLHDHCSYVYHGKGLTTATAPTRPILCEPLTNHEVAGMTILFADGTAEFFPTDKAVEILQRTNYPTTQSSPH
jgi:hypothetical protein